MILLIIYLDYQAGFIKCSLYYVIIKPEQVIYACNISIYVIQVMLCKWACAQYFQVSSVQGSLIQ